jgi:2-methylcitrate dehydratase PrpD
MDDVSAAATSTKNLARKLGDYFAKARFEELPPAVVDKACEHIWYLAIRAVQGHRHELSAQARMLALRLSEGGGSNTIIGSAETATPIDAAFVNSSQMRALEVGDNLWPMGVHAGIIVVPAALGGQVSPTVLEGRFGLFETFLGEFPGTLHDPDLSTPRGQEILGARTKRLPGTAWNVVPIELMRELVRSEGLTPQNVARIDIRLSDARRNFTIGHHLAPYEPWRASSSVPFQIAMLVLDGGESHYERYWQNENPELLEIVRRMMVTLVPHEDDNFARIAVTTTEGRRLSREGVAFEYPRWDDQAELLAAGGSVLPADQLRRAADLLDDLPNVADVGELMGCFRAKPT